MISFILWSIFLYLFHGIGITLGYHRRLAHKSFKMAKWVEYIFVIGGYLAMMGAPISWVAIHRRHHQVTDIEGKDPHTPRDGFFHSLVAWMFYVDKYQTTPQARLLVPDLMKDKFYRLLGDTALPSKRWLNFGSCILFRYLILILFGKEAFYASLITWWVVFWSPQLVNSLCHIPALGYRNFSTDDDSTNVPWLFAFGENWHNTHHYIPKSARHGIFANEFDITWETIKLLEKLGLVWEIKDGTSSRRLANREGNSSR